MGEPSKVIIVRGRVKIEKKPKNDHEDWVYWQGFPVSFEELYYILKWIGECEDKKYPEEFHKGKVMVVEFINDAIMNGFTYEELAIRYHQPKNKKVTYGPEQRKFSFG